MTLSLEPFRTDVLKEIMADHKENYNNDDLLALYCFFGGVPKYVELLMDNDCTDMEKMVEYMTRPDSQFFDEGRNMLIQEFGKQYATYFSILGLIAAGDVTLLSVEMGCHGGDTPWVAHEDDFICQLFRFYVEMEDASVLVDDKF